jgi:hypothetical protein
VELSTIPDANAVPIVTPPCRPSCVFSVTSTYGGVSRSHPHQIGAREKFQKISKKSPENSCNAPAGK